MHIVGPALGRALEPILKVVRPLSLADRRAWFFELNDDAPALVDALEKLLHEDGAIGQHVDPASP